MKGRGAHTKFLTLFRSTSSWYSSVLLNQWKLSTEQDGLQGSHKPFAHGEGVSSGGSG